MEKQWRHPGRQYVPVRKQRHRVRIIAWCAIAFFVVLNIAIWAIFRDRTYPGTKVMNTTIGSVAYGDLLDTVASAKVLPQSVTLEYEDTKKTISLEDLGISQDAARTTANANDQKLLIPITNFFKQPELKAPISIREQAFASATADLAKAFQGDAVPGHLSLEGSAVSITPPKDKYRLDDTRLQSFIIAALDNGKTTITVPVKTTPTAEAANLDKAKAALEKQFRTSISLTVNGTESTLSKEDIASWYVPSGTTYAPSPDAIVLFLQGKVQSTQLVKDNAAIVAAIQKALLEAKPYTATIIPVTPSKTLSYCTAVKGVSADEIPTLQAKLASTFADSRGWSLNGTILYKPATAGCNFTVWLSSANLMPTFGAICDSMWSCRVGPNVVLNYDRWQNASPAWNSFGGTLQEYRYMVINHETGHWLGFGHDQCPGAGMQAPVMQQQSINLQGCVFSPWPNDSEKAVLAGRYTSL